MKNLNSHKKAVIFYVLPFLKGIKMSELDVAIPFVISWCSWALEGQQIGSGHQGLTDMSFVFAIVTLVKYRQRYSARERPFQRIVPIWLHHMDKERYMCTITGVYTIWIDSKTQFKGNSQCLKKINHQLPHSKKGTTHVYYVLYQKADYVMYERHWNERELRTTVADSVGWWAWVALLGS